MINKVTFDMVNKRFEEGRIMEKDNCKICVLDCYFEPLNEDSACYMISDKDLTKLIINIREIEF